jgi:hypothetical protein
MKKNLIIVVIIVIGLALGCKKPTLTLEQAQQNPKETLIAAMNRMFDGKSYMIVVKNGKGIGDVDCGVEKIKKFSPDSFSYEIGNPKAYEKTMITGDVVLTSSRENPTLKASPGYVIPKSGNGRMYEIFTKEGFAKLISSADVKVNKEKVDSSFAFTYSIPMDSTKSEAQFFTLIDEATGLPSTSTVGGEFIKTNFPNCKTQIDYSSFDGNVPSEPSK